ncbi:MAG: transcription elongation factor GreA [Patescibacteria group bacterium]
MPNYITKAGLDQLNNELHDLKTVQLPKIQDDIREARSLGDLRENSALDAAKTQEETFNIRISEIENILTDYELIEEEDHTSSRVKIGSHVKIKYIETKAEMQLTIVGTFEVDPINGKISNESPIAKAILGKKVGDEVEFKIQTKSHKIKIIELN